MTAYSDFPVRLVVAELGHTSIAFSRGLRCSSPLARQNPPILDDPLDLDLDGLYARYVVTCWMSGVDPVPREGADGLIAEWQEVLLGRPEPTTH